MSQHKDPWGWEVPTYLDFHAYFTLDGLTFDIDRLNFNLCVAYIYSSFYKYVYVIIPIFLSSLLLFSQLFLPHTVQEWKHF